MAFVSDAAMELQLVKDEATDQEVDVRRFPSMHFCYTDFDDYEGNDKCPTVLKGSVPNRNKTMSCIRKRQLQAELRRPLLLKGARSATLWVPWPCD